MNLKTKYDLKSRLHAKIIAGTALVAGALTSVNAFADGVDVSTVTASISAAGAAAATIGLAVLSMHYGIKLYKWVKGAG